MKYVLVESTNNWYVESIDLVKRKIELVNHVEYALRFDSIEEARSLAEYLSANDCFSLIGYTAVEVKE